MKRNKAVLSAVFFCFYCLFSLAANAQLAAYTGKSNDNNCKLIYLVNPSSKTIYYIAGMSQNELNDCRTFSIKKSTETTYEINISKNEDAYLLLLPKDTIAYKILMGSENESKNKQLLLLAKRSDEVININNDKKRLKKINKLEGGWLRIPVTE